jgi:hypothetical protein
MLRHAGQLRRREISRMANRCRALCRRAFLPWKRSDYALFGWAFELRDLRARAEITSHSGARVGAQSWTGFCLLTRCGSRPLGCGPQAPWLCCSLLTYRTGYASSLAPRHRPGGLQQNANLFLPNPKQRFGLPARARNSFLPDLSRGRNTPFAAPPSYP